VTGLRNAVAVAKYTASDGALLLRFATAADTVSGATIEGLASPLLAGTHAVDLVEGDRRRSLELTIMPRGKVFDLVADGDGGRISARGMGIADPEFPDSLLVSWWCSEQRPAGIVKYELGDEPGTIVPTYTSIMLEATGFNDVLGGRATGDTKHGFPGSYSITYEGEGGTSFGPFDWTITPRGAVLDLTWDAGGARVIDGFGFVDPDSSHSIVVVYWGAGQHAPGEKDEKEVGDAGR